MNDTHFKCYNNYTHGSLPINRFDYKFFVIERNILNFTPRKPNFWCQSATIDKKFQYV